MTTLTINLPTHLAQQARQAGLLRGDRLARLLEEALQAQKPAAPQKSAQKQTAASETDEMEQMLAMILSDPIDENFIPPRNDSPRADPFQQAPPQGNLT